MTSDEARAEDEAFAHIETQQSSKDRLTRRLAAVRQHRFSTTAGDMLRAQAGDAAAVARMLSALHSEVRALQARVAALEAAAR